MPFARAGALGGRPGALGLDASNSLRRNTVDFGKFRRPRAGTSHRA